MRRASSVVGVAAALTTISLVGSSAWAASCPTVATPISVYTAAGFSCNVDGVIFSGMTITVSSGSIGNATITALDPTLTAPENALELIYSAGNGTATDFTWQYTVAAAAGFILTDAASSLTGVAPATLSESLLGDGNPSPFPTSVGHITLSLPGAPTGFTSITPPQFSLLAVKDQATGAPGEASALINGFSVSRVPGPIVGGGMMPGLIAACGALIGLARRRRRRTA
jgi:hypothetical protein